MEFTEFDKHMSAVAFAEVGELQTAREMLGSGRSAKKVKAPEPAKAKKPYLQTAVFGAVSLTAYVVLFQNEKLVTDTFTMGGWYAAYPVLTALAFSFVHGAFGSSLLSVLGLEAKKN